LLKRCSEKEEGARSPEDGARRTQPPVDCL
jgi:hypothetical protein